MNGLPLTILAVLCLASAAAAQPVTIRVQSRTAVSGQPYALSVSVTGADSLAGLLLDFTYGPSRNRLLAAPACPWDPVVTRARTVPALYPDSSGVFRTGWVVSPAVQGNDSILALNFMATGTSGTADTVRVSVVQAVDQNGTGAQALVQPGIVTFVTTAAVEPGDPGALPRAYRLGQSHPNPVRFQSEIQFSLPIAERVEISVYDVGGRNVATLVRSTLGPGNHKAHLDAAGLSNGVYTYRMKAGAFQETRKFVVIR